MPLFRNGPDKHTGSSGPGAGHVRLSDEQKLDWLRLMRTPNIGPATFWRLINHCGGARQALEMLPDFFRRGSAREGLQPASLRRVEQELKTARKLGATLVARGEPGYPTLLSHLRQPPPLLYIKGRPELATRPAIAMVGSRNGSVVGVKFTRKLAGELATAGFAIVSGLARGIDAAAHEASLDKDGGAIAIIAGGIDNYYPPQNLELQKKIETGGLVISETPPGHEPRASDFPRRNRIISGASLGTLVVEAGLRSGSLITARLAGEQGREVMAVPGHPLDPRAAGANRLLMNGASMITCARDAINLLSPLSGEPPRQPPKLFEHESEPIETPPAAPDASAREQVVGALSFHPVDIDELIRMTGLPTQQVKVALLELELSGHIHHDDGQMVRLTPRN